ncbi:hypothetical protein FJ417_24655 [Mesorhizobium sp. B3-1-7]|uniref:hypothetical protein n=1 Tax=Mesorhizobium sp. B3-1-7 TaxID=2589894 RepID=UPI00112B1122|nr:hypothetical protein [Mesorhizobium sp. B3-1-7]TPI54744.1 hypothetical protein FJ417_24655 [Mesorhizobium sp. B3-1-7]
MSILKRGKASPTPVTAEAVSEASAALDAAKRVVEAIAAKQEAANRHSENLAAERARVALAAHTGDAAAKARLDAINVEVSTHGSEMASLAAAIAEARKNVQAAEDRVAEHDIARRTAAAREIASQIIAEAETIDAALAEAAVALGRRDALRTALVKTGAVRPEVSNQLAGRLTINRAMAAAGLHGFASFDGAAGTGTARSTLARHDVAVLGAATNTPAAAA